MRFESCAVTTAAPAVPLVKKYNKEDLEGSNAPEGIYKRPDSTYRLLVVGNGSTRAVLFVCLSAIEKANSVITNERIWERIPDAKLCLEIREGK